jgi:ankyrin repeat protein
MPCWAPENGCYSVAETLLDIEDPNSEGSERNTPLHIAGMKGFKSVVKLLLEREDRIVEDSSGLTPLHYAIKCGSVAILNLLSNFLELRLSSSPLCLPLHAVASNGSVEMAKRLLDQKFDSALQDSEGGTALHVAACKAKTRLCCFSRIM